MATSGKYSCEVSLDAPSFHTLISAGELDVVGKFFLLLLIVSMDFKFFAEVFLFFTLSSLVNNNKKIKSQKC